MAYYDVMLHFPGLDSVWKASRKFTPKGCVLEKGYSKYWSSNNQKLT